MQRTRLARIPSWLVLVGSVLGLGLMVPLLYGFQEAPDDLSDSPYLRIDPEKIVTSARDSRVPCGECHVNEFAVWEETPHATGFDELHRSDQAQAILDRMGFRLSKRESLCLRCHYTAQIEGGEARAIAGVSCESCHGAARDWLDIHNDYGGFMHDTEPAEHRAQRVEQSTANGMLRPSDNLYAVAANCFECHTVPQEELINKGGHPSGSAFDLLEWSAQIRHNFLPAQWSNDETNHAPSAERKRLMLVIGRMLDYEYSIRGAAEATDNGIYAKAMERRVKQARRSLERVARAVTIPEVNQILSVGGSLQIAPGRRQALLAAAGQISAQAQQFTRMYDGSTLADLDPIVEGEPVASAEEPPAEEPLAEPEPPAGGAAPADASTGEVEEPPAASEAARTGDEAGTSNVAAVRVAGEPHRRPPWFPSTGSLQTLGPSGCSCHFDQLDWLSTDAHSESATALLNEAPRAVQIAQTYGLSRADMKRGNQICMSCHGTVVSGEEAEEVFDGVSCESCHGPGSAYQRKHQDDDGYAQAASLGMTPLEQAGVRADNCARCHHITDERLISSGHSSGAGFTLGDRNQQIKHWEAPVLAAGDLNTAFQRAVQARPVPQNVPIATATPAAPALSPGASTASSRPADPQPNTPAEAQAAASTPSEASPAPTPQAPRPQPPRVRPVDPSAPAPALEQELSLPPLPAVTDSTSTEMILLIVKTRLELLYQALERSN